MVPKNLLRMDIEPEIFSALNEYMHDGVIVLDGENRVLLINPAGLRLLKLRTASIGKRIDIALKKHPLLARICTAKSGSIHEISLAYAPTVYLEVRVTPYKIKSKNCVGKFVYLHDITESKRILIALTESERRFRSFFENAPIAIVLVRDRQFLYANPAFLRMMDFESMDQVRRLSLEEIILPEEKDGILERHTQRLQGGNVPEVYEGVGIRRSGMRFPFRARTTLIKLEDGPAVIGFITDLSESKKAELSLVESENRYRLLAENARDVIWTMDFDGRFTYVSPSVEELRGFSSEEVLDQGIEEAICAPYVPDFEKIFIETRQQIQMGEEGAIFVIEAEQPCKDGSTVWTETQVHVMYDDEGKPIALLGVSRNISDRKKLKMVEYQQNKLVEALYESGKALSSTLDFEQVLDIMLEKIQTVLPFDAATIYLVERERARVVRAKHYDRYGAEVAQRISNISFDISKTENLRTMYETHQPFVIPDVNAFTGWDRSITGNPVRSWVGTPIIAQDKVIAFFSLDKLEAGFYDERHAEILGMFGGQAALAMENARLFATTQRQAITDPLTEIFNRRHLYESGLVEFERARRHKRPLALIMLDIDHFKNVNDTYGHLAGDDVLKDVAQILQDNLRKIDLLGRYGGEEFICILPDADLEMGEVVAERLRRDLSRLRVNSFRGEIAITASFGVAKMEYRKDFTLETLIDYADRALYAAKNAGRNCVKIFPGTPGSE